MSGSNRHVLAALTILAVPLSVTACGGQSRIAPTILGSNGGSTVGTSASQRNIAARAMVFNVDLTGKSPDARYQLRSLHLAHTKVHQAFSYQTAGGMVTQTEYGTPYGPLTTVQSPLSPPNASTRAVTILRPSTGSKAGALPPGYTAIVASGRTDRGANWVITKSARGPAWDVHVEFADSAIDASAPVSVPVATIEDVIGALY